MEPTYPCCCCLLRPPDKDLKTPYTWLGVTEIYSDMLQNCFQLHLTLGDDANRGICGVCVGRLRDASDFKLQVQLSHAWRERDLRATDGEPLGKLDSSDESEDYCILRDMEASCLWEPRPESACGREQLARACSVRLERLHHHEAPHTTPPTSDHQSSLTTSMPDTEQHTESTEHTDRASPLHTPPDTYACGKQLTRKSDSFTALKTYEMNESLTIKTKPKKPTSDNRLSGVKTYRCASCPEVFSVESDLAKHKFMHTNGKFIGDPGNKQFAHKRSLAEHTRVRTRKVYEKKYTCDHCAKSFAFKSQIAEHMLKHGDKRFKCDVCNMRFVQKTSLKRHIFMHALKNNKIKTDHMRVRTRKVGEKKYTCNNCAKRFAFKSQIAEHMLKHNKRFKCDICNMGFAQKTNLRRHMLAHAKKNNKNKTYHCENCRMKFRSAVRFARHTSKCRHADDELFSCDVCNEQFAYKSNLWKHARIHTEPRKYCCDVCNKILKYKNSMKKHMRLHQEEKLPLLLCNVCGKTSSNGNLRRHLRIHVMKGEITSKEAGVEPYTCEICGAQFAEKSRIITHLKRHEAKKSFSVNTTYGCNICGMQFKFEDRLARHKCRHKGPVPCEVCKKQVVNIATHMRLHNGEKLPYRHHCQYCFKLFQYKFLMERHERIHTGVKPFTCEVCHKQFALKGNLRKHEQCHTGTKVPCDMCNKQFFSMSGVRKHKLFVHMKDKSSLLLCGVCGKGFQCSSHLKRHQKRIHSDEVQL